jgi:ectoine hydroxylase-related dioxygenase (phytanoyl-CoA dioxygenase family)
VLDQEVPEPLINYERVVSMDLKAGEMSLHDDGLLHGSLPNASDRMRVGFTMRFCPPDVKCDLDVWPNFETYVARGEDRLLLNPRGQVPNGERYPVRRFQHSSEFAS